MSSRSNGLYWCKIKQSEEWSAIEWAEGKWVVGLIDCQADVVQVGPRIPTPDEPWQCVPIEPTMKMRQSAGLGAHQELRMWKAWDAMLSTAPKPEDVCKSPD